MSLPLCVKRMQFLSLPQWCSAWSAPESTWCGGTGVATPRKAWTSTTQCTVKPPARARRTRSTSGGLTPWGTTCTITRSHRGSAWVSWEREAGPARSSSLCHLGAACPTLELTGTRSSPCCPRRSDPQRPQPEETSAQARTHAEGGETWTEVAEATHHRVTQPCPVPISLNNHQFWLNKDGFPAPHWNVSTECRELIKKLSSESDAFDLHDSWVRRVLHVFVSRFSFVLDGFSLGRAIPARPWSSGKSC